jgi:hypothetical protein
MNKQHQELAEILTHYRPITLEEMDSVKLMNRTDTKYFFHVNLLKDVLTKAVGEYRVLEINYVRQFNYLTTYFDTPEFKLYNEHLNGKLNRYKIRQRRYDSTGTEFFEIKFKTNKGRTLKSRIENNLQDYLNEQTDKFLRKKTPYEISQLQKAIINGFVRITLVNNEKTERVTLDYNISFSNHNKEHYCPQLGIAEIKQDNLSGQSPLIKILRELKLRPDGISKYCLGVASLYDNVKINTLKPRLLKIQNL